MSKGMETGGGGGEGGRVSGLSLQSLTPIPSCCAVPETLTEPRSLTHSTTSGSAASSSPQSSRQRFWPSLDVRITVLCLRFISRGRFLLVYVDGTGIIIFQKAPLTTVISSK